MTRPNVLILIFAVMTFLPSVASGVLRTTPLHEASGNGDVAEVKRLLADPGGRLDLDSGDADRQTPLRRAIWDVRPEVVKILKDAGGKL